MQLQERVKKTVASVETFVTGVTATEKEFKMYKLYDGSTIFDFELPAPNMLEGQPLVAKGKLVRRRPIVGCWRVDRDSIEVVGY